MERNHSRAIGLGWERKRPFVVSGTSSERRIFMKCPYCGFESPAPFEKCPSCGQPQTAQTAPSAQPVSSAPTANQQAAYPTTAPYTPPAYTHPAYTPPSYNPYVNAASTKGMTGGETASVIIAIIVSVLSLIIGFVIFVTYAAVNTNHMIDNSDDYGMDAFDDFDSNDYLDDFFDNYFGKKDDSEKYSIVSPADLHTPITYEDDFYSFSEGFVNTKYEVELDETYRGQAALQLLDGAALPKIDESTSEIYLVKFKVRITEQDKDSIVSLHYTLPAALSSSNQTLAYEVLDSLNYKDAIGLMSNGEEGTRWVAFIVDKNDPNPLIMWYKYDERYFRNKAESVSNPAGLEAGGAIEEKSNSDAETKSGN